MHTLTSMADYIETKVILKAQNYVMESYISQVMSALSIKAKIQVEYLDAKMIELL